MKARKVGRPTKKDKMIAYNFTARESAIKSALANVPRDRIRESLRAVIHKFAKMIKLSILTTILLIAADYFGCFGTVVHFNSSLTWEGTRYDISMTEYSNGRIVKEVYRYGVPVSQQDVVCEYLENQCK